jgi:hypothetical protein
MEQSTMLALFFCDLAVINKTSDIRLAAVAALAAAVTAICFVVLDSALRKI